MLEYVQILSCPEELEGIFRFIKYGIYPLIQIGIPIILIIFGAIDLGKAVMSSDDKEIKGATSKLIKRAVAAVAVFFVATLVSLIMNMLGSTGTETSGQIGGENVSWRSCWIEI